jgi:hypothetical protein
MGILDDAIREHLDLKRKHGARENELREIEDEAFGSSDQADPFVAGGELFGEVSAEATAEEGAIATSSAGATEMPLPDVGDEEPTRLVEPEALRREPEAPSEPATPPPEPAAPEITRPEPDLGSLEEPTGGPESVEPLPGQTELPGQEEIPGQERLDEPIESYRPSTEPAPEPASPSESLEELIAEEEPFPEDSAAPPPDLPVEPGPSADRGGALEGTELEPEEEPEAPLEPLSEPESSVPEPPPPPPAAGNEPPGRARGRVDVPTQEHPPPGETGGAPAVPPPEADTGPELEAEPEPPPPEEPGSPQLYDFESDEEPLGDGGLAEPADDFEALGPPDEEAPYLDEEEPYAEEPAAGTESETVAPFEEPGTEVRPAVEDEEGHEGSSFDPEESYEEGDTDDDLWFEKGPPKDFDFD